MQKHVLFFAALADATRLRLLHLMKGGEICVCFLQGVLEASQPKISRHLAYLRRAGLVEARREGKWMHYRLRKQPRGFQPLLAKALQHVAGDPAIRRDRERLDQIQCCPSRYGVTSPAGRQAKK
jgi:ArsR family transcriptional regulator